MSEADRRAILQMNDRLRHQAMGLRSLAATERAAAQRWADGLARRHRSRAFCCPFLIRGGSEEVQPERADASTILTCQVCRSAIGQRQSAVLLQTRPAHFDCMHPTRVAVRGSRDGAIKVEVAGVLSEDGQSVVAWHHCCGVCGSSWRTDWLAVQCPTCAGKA